MMLLFLTTLIFFAVIQSVSAQFVTAPNDLIVTKGFLDLQVRYKQVETGTCELDPNIKSFSGYVDVAEDEHVFFWYIFQKNGNRIGFVELCQKVDAVYKLTGDLRFFEARNADPTEAPLTTWIGGGPGGSIMSDVFSFNGPCHIDRKGVVNSSPYSWSYASNMLFIDQPVQSGFSYSIPVPGYKDNVTGEITTLPDSICPDHLLSLGIVCGTYSFPDTPVVNSTFEAAPTFWKTLQGFMGAFPQYSRHSYNFVTESYGGHYGPVFNAYVVSQNAKIAEGILPNARHINLEAILIGNGGFDPLIQYQAKYNFTVSPGNTYDYFPFNSSIQTQMYHNLYDPGNCIDQLTDCHHSGSDDVCAAAQLFCAMNVDLVDRNTSRFNNQDIREPMPDLYHISHFDSRMNSAPFLKAIGAYQNYTDASDIVLGSFFNAGNTARSDNNIQDLANLLHQNVSVTLFSGDADYICNWYGTEAVAYKIASAAAALGYSDLESAGYVKVSTTDGIIHGQVKQSGKFSHVRVYEAGHAVVDHQPEIAFAIFERAIQGKDIATGKVSVREGYQTIGTKNSLYREGNSTVQF